MGRSYGSQIKWAAYAAGYLLLFFLKSSIFNRLPIHGAVPEVAPLAVAAVGCFEGTFGGAAYGLAVGLFCSAVYYRGGSMMIAICTVIGMLSGTTTNRQIGKNFLGGLVCGTMGILILEFCRVFYYHFFGRNSLETVLSIAVPEGLYSAAFIIPVYLLYVLIYLRFRTDTEL